MRIEGISSLATAVSWLAQTSAIGSFCSGCGSPVGSCTCSVVRENNRKDSVEISSAARTLQEKKPDEQGTSTNGSKELSEEEKQQVAELKKRDMEVRAHEAAHMAAGAGIVRGGASYSFQKGPDGRDYAVGGEVSIDTGEGKTPEETIIKMERVRAAALAPANPSGQDIRVAADATSKAAKARMELIKENDSNGSQKTGGYDKQGQSISFDKNTNQNKHIDLVA